MYANEAMTTEEVLEQITKKLDALDKKVDSGFTKIDERFQSIDKELKVLNKKLDREIEDVADFQSTLMQAIIEDKERIKNLETHLGISKN